MWALPLFLPASQAAALNARRASEAADGGLPPKTLVYLLLVRVRVRKFGYSMGGYSTRRVI